MISSVTPKTTLKSARCSNSYIHERYSGELAAADASRLSLKDARELLLAEKQRTSAQLDEMQKVWLKSK